jgi:HK97 family phage portal protein
MTNPILAMLRGDHLPRPRRGAATSSAPTERKMYLYPDYINPSIATSPDVYAAIRMGTLVHGPGATEMTYRAWHHEDMNSAVFACLSAICTAYPEAPAKVFLETEPGERDEQPDHPLKQLLDNPNPYLTREQVLHYTTWCKHIGGNAYWRKIRSGGPGTNVVALWPISPTRVQPVTTKEDALRGIFISWYEYVFDPMTDPERIPPDDIIHFRLGIDDKDHRVGASPLARLVREVAGDEEAHKWQTSMLENGGTVGMLIQVPIDSSITVDQAEDMKQRFEERFGGDNRGRTGVLMGGAKAEPYGFAPDQMDMKSLHRIPEERIAAVLRVPAIIAGLGAGLDRSTYANFREAREMFAEMTLMPLYAFDAATLNMQLKPEFSSDPRLKIAFDVTDLRAFQEDEDAKWKRLDTAVKTGWVRPNEARTDVGLPPDMDQLEAPMAQMFGMSQRSGQEDEEPAANKALRKPKVPSQRQLNRMADVLQALVDIGMPGTQDELEQYFLSQHERVNSNLARG